MSWGRAFQAEGRALTVQVQAGDWGVIRCLAFERGEQ